MCLGAGRSWLHLRIPSFMYSYCIPIVLQGNKQCRFSECQTHTAVFLPGHTQASEYTLIVIIVVCVDVVENRLEAFLHNLLMWIV